MDSISTKEKTACEEVRGFSEPAISFGCALAAPSPRGKKEVQHKRKKRRIAKAPTQENGSLISKPFNFVHRLHVEEDLTWTDLSGNETPSNLQLVEKLGEGSYGEVYKAQAVTGAILVVKVIDIELDNEDTFRKEIEILRCCQHPNIVPYYGSIYQKDSVWILMEYCQLGSLRDVMDTCRPLTEPEAAVVCFHTLKALIYLHSRNIIHRDVKAANILLSNQAHVKIADFGVSEQFSGHGAESRKSDKVMGTPLWMAPEVATACALSSLAGKYDFKADIWSLGITVIEMVQGAPPFAKMNPMRAMKMVPVRPPPRLEEQGRWSPELNDFISQCLTKNPSERPRAIDLFLHPFIQQVYSLKPEEILQPLIDEYKSAKEARASCADEPTDQMIKVVPSGQALFFDSLKDLTTKVTDKHGTGEDEEKRWDTVVIKQEEVAFGQFRQSDNMKLETPQGEDQSFDKMEELTNTAPESLAIHRKKKRKTGDGVEKATKVKNQKRQKKRKLKQEEPLEAHDSTSWQEPGAVERRQASFIEERAALVKQIMQIDSILHSMRGTISTASERPQSKVEVRMEKMRDQLVAQLKSVGGA